MTKTNDTSLTVIESKTSYKTNVSLPVSSKKTTATSKDLLNFLTTLTEEKTTMKATTTNANHGMKNREATKINIKGAKSARKGFWTMLMAFPSSSKNFVNEFFQLNPAMGMRSALGAHIKGDTCFELVLLKKETSEFTRKSLWKKDLRSNLNFAQDF